MPGIIVISDPGPSRVVTTNVLSGDLLHLTFDPADTIVDLDHGSLTIAFDRGGTVVIQNFAEAVGQGVVFIKMQDGTSINAAELVHALMLNPQDIEPGKA